MARKITSKEIEAQIQALLKRKKEAEEYENRFVIVEPLISRISEVLKAKNIELTEGEMEHVIAPVRNIEKFVRDRFERKHSKKVA